MAKGTFDGAARLLILNSGVVSIDAQINAYSDWKEWVRVGDNSKYLPMFRTVGGDPTSSDQALGCVFFLINGWRIRPQEANHELAVSGLLRVDGGGNPFVTTLGPFNVSIVREFSNLATQVLTGGGAGGFTDADRLNLANDKANSESVLEQVSSLTEQIAKVIKLQKTTLSDQTALQHKKEKGK